MIQAPNKTDKLNGTAITRDDIDLIVTPSKVVEDGKAWRVVATYGEKYHRDTITVSEPAARANFIQTFATTAGVNLVDVLWLDSEIQTAADCHLATKESDVADDTENPKPIRPSTFCDLAERYPRLRDPIIEGVLRQGETANIIAPPKTGKSWSVVDLALSIVTGRDWLGMFPVESGRVLILDNELHGETVVHRVRKVADARGIDPSEYEQDLHIVSLRGCLLDINTLGPRLLDHIEPGTYRIIIIDAFYRAIPSGTDENSNSGIAQVYNAVDGYALHLGCGFVLIHHSTKGNQASKGVTDVALELVVKAVRQIPT